MKRQLLLRLIAICLGALLFAGSETGATGLTLTPVAPVSADGGSPPVFTLPPVRANASGSGVLRILNQNASAAQLTLSLTTSNGSSSQVFTISEFSRQVTVGGSFEGENGAKDIVISFSPPATGLHEAFLTVSRDNDPADQLRYRVRATGTAPQISVFDPSGTGLADGNSPIVTLPGTAVGTSATNRFRIENTGDHPLTITGITTTAGSDFSVADTPTTVAARTTGINGSALFSVNFTPSATGLRNATLQIFHDDSSKAPFLVPLAAIASGPRIVVRDPGNNVLASTAGGPPRVDLGNVISSETFTFTIENEGDRALNISSLTISGEHDSEFVVGGIQPGASIAAVSGRETSSRTFTITFTPGAPGQRTASLQIVHDDSDASPFLVTLLGAARSPQIVVKSPSGDSLPATSAASPDVKLGSTNLDTPSDHVFSIENTGDQALTIVSISSSNSGEFQVSGIPAAVAAATGSEPGSAAFTLTFSPTVIGTRTTLVEIIHNDSENSPFRMQVSAVGTRVDFTATGVEITGILTDTPAGDVRAEISTDPDFLATIETHAGAANPGATNGTRSSSRFSNPSGIVADANGNLFVTDTANNLIRMVGTDDRVTTIAGSPGLSGYGFADGDGSRARFQLPTGIAGDSEGNLYIADTLNHTIRKLTGVPGGAWTVTTLAGGGDAGHVDGEGPSARFNLPQGLAVDSSGNVYVADTGNHRIRKITPAGRVSTLAGTGIAGATDGNAAVATFNSPLSIVLDTQNNLYVADGVNHKIRRIDPSTNVTTIAGDGFTGAPTSTRLNCPTGLLMANDDTIYFTDKLNHAVRKLTRTGNTWSLSTITGTGQSGFTNGLQPQATFNHPTSLALDTTGNLIVADSQNNALRRIILRNVSALATSSGTTVSATLDAGQLGINSYLDYFVRWVDANFNPIATTHPAISFQLVDFPDERGLQASAITNSEATLQTEINPRGSETSTRFEVSTDPALIPPLQIDTLPGLSGAPRGITIDSSGNRYVTDQNQHGVWLIDASNSAPSLLAGGGIAGFADSDGNQPALFDHPGGIAAGPNGNLFVADTRNHRVRKIEIATGTVTTIAGSGVAGHLDHDDALRGSLLYPTGLALNGDGTKIYIADRGNHRVRVVELGPSPSLQTLAGSGSRGSTDGPSGLATFDDPTGVALGPDGAIYVADRGNHQIRRVTPGGDVTTLAGAGIAGFLDSPNGPDALFSHPSDLTVDSAGVLHVADEGNNRLRKINSAGVVTTVAGSGQAGHLDSTGILSPPALTAFYHPSAIAQHAGTIYLAESGNNTVRLVFRGTAQFLPAAGSPFPSTTTSFQPTTTSLSALSPGTPYFYRTISENERGRTVSAIATFTTLTSPQLVVVDESTARRLASSQDDPVSFGSTPVGIQVSRTFTLSNGGQSELVISSISVPSGYTLQTPDSLPDGGGSLQGGESANIILTMDAGASGTYSGNLQIDSNDAIPSVAIPVTGAALDPPSVTNLLATNRTLTSATLRASINPEGTDTTAWIEYSLDPELSGVEITTFAGSTSGFVGGPRQDAKFDSPTGLAKSPSGTIYIADTGNHSIRAIDPDGTTRTIAGTGAPGFREGQGLQAQFSSPTAVTVASDETLYVADSGNHRIRSISPTGEVSTIAGTGEAMFTDGVATAARFNTPVGLTLEADDLLYVADTLNNRIRTLAQDSQGAWTVGTLVEPGSLLAPRQILVGVSGELYVTETGRHAIQRVDRSGTVRILAGQPEVPGYLDGAGIEARFNLPRGLGRAPNGHILVADSANHAIREIAPDGAVVTLAGTGQPRGSEPSEGSAELELPAAVILNGDGNFLASEPSSGTLRQILSTTVVNLLPGTLQGSSAVEISLDLEDLIPDTTYYFRTRARNSAGTTTDQNIQSFVSRPLTPFETWQVNEFQNDAITPSIAGAQADPNNDGILNLTKYAHGISPRSLSCEGLPVVTVNPANAVITYTRDQAATDLVYSIQKRTGDDWVALSSVVEQYVPLPGDATRPWVNPIQVIASIPRSTDTSGTDKDPLPATIYRLLVSFKIP